MAAGAARLQAAQYRSLCYDKYHRWMVTVVMTLLIYSRVSSEREWDRWARAVPHPNFGAISSDIGSCDVFVAQ